MNFAHTPNQQVAVMQLEVVCLPPLTSTRRRREWFTQTAGGGNAVCLFGIRCEEEEEEEDRYLHHYTPVHFESYRFGNANFLHLLF